ncbi:MAG TPA: tail fiber protein [Thermoanaerobaculia bacterium]|jgi:microcystin-dependent protein
MSQQFIGEVRIFAFPFAPKGWALADGQTMPISQNQPLFALLGMTFGGDGRTTFALPDFRGRAGIGVGPGYQAGSRGGETTHTLTNAEMPQHTHVLQAAAQAPDATSPAVNALAQAQLWTAPPANATTSNANVRISGLSQPHENMQPYLVLNFCIALTGSFPQR